MTLLELANNVRIEFDRRNLKSSTRYNALNNVVRYIQNCHAGDMSVFDIPKKEFKIIYEEYKESIDRKISSAEKSAIDELYNQLNNGLKPSLDTSSLKISKEPIVLTDDNLLSPENFKKVSDLCETMVPNVPGLYAIRIKDINDLPTPFCAELENRGHDLLYIGIASTSLRERFWREELNHRKPATFFRSLGAMLGYRPEKGSLYGKDTRNYKFSIDDTEAIKNWIRTHLLVNYVCCAGNLDEIETKLIEESRPIVNIAKNHHKMQLMSDLRAECVRIAKEKI